MEKDQSKNITFKGFCWKIQNFSRLNTKKLYSDIFVIGGQQWRMLLLLGVNNVEYLSIYLDVPDAPHLPQDWKRHAYFRLRVINHIDSQSSLARETQHDFNQKENDWGFSSFMPLTEFYDSSRGYLVQDKCVDEKVFESVKGGNQGHGDLDAKPEASTPVQENVSNSKEIQIDQTTMPEPVEEVPSTASDPVLSDFKGLWKVDKAFVPLLEKVCALHPSLVECQRKRSRMFGEWAFTALGRVLYFLKTKKVSDMTKEACEHLQVLWEEVDAFKFDMAWLEPHVQFAAGMDTYLQKAEQVKKLKDDVTSLEIHLKNLRAKLPVAEVDVEVARRNLAKAVEGFQQMDMEAVVPSRNSMQGREAGVYNHSCLSPKLKTPTQERNGRAVETSMQVGLTSTPPRVPHRRPNVSQVVPTPRLENSESVDKKSEGDNSSYSSVSTMVVRNQVGFYREIGVEDTFVPIPDDTFSDRSLDTSSFFCDDFSSPCSIDTFSPIHLEPIQHTGSPAVSCLSTESAKFVSNVNTEMADFSGLGIDIDPTYVPLLEEVCARHPSLVQSQMNKTTDFKKWAFTALGQVLYFLGTTKVKDMKEEALEYLQGLWEELETFRFDLTWLEPHVQSALDMKIHLEKTNQVKLLKNKIDALEIDAKKLKAELAVAESNLDEAKRTLERLKKKFRKWM